MLYELNIIPLLNRFEAKLYVSCNDDIDLNINSNVFFLR